MNAGSGGFDPEGDVRQALAAVVRDHGPAILADPRHLGGALNVLLPTAPEETGILVAAARAGTSAQLAQQAAMDGPSAALEAVSASLAQSGVVDSRASSWAVREIARAMGFPMADPPPATPMLGGMAPWPVSGAVPAPPPAPPAPPGPPPLSVPATIPTFVLPPTPSPFTPPPAPSASIPPGAASAFPEPSAPSPFAGPSAPGPLGQGTPGGPPQGPPWAGAGIPSRPSPPGPPPGSGSSGGPPPRTPPAGPRRKGRRPIALIAAAVVFVLIVVYFMAAATVGFFPFRAAASVATPPTPTPAPAFTSTPTISPSSSPTAKPSSSASPSATGSPSLSPLASLLPSYVTGNTANSCSPVPTDDELASGVSAEELCDLTQNQNVAETYVLYVGFPTEGLATTYFNSLLTGNGMKTTQGNCQNLTLVTASDGSSQYCEGTYKTTGAHSNSGSYFVFTGSPSFQLGNSNPVSSLDVCSAVNSVDVLGFTDPTYAAVGITMSCLGTEQDQEVNSDFLAGNFFLGS